MSVSFLAFQRWQRLWASLNCPSCPSPNSPLPVSLPFSLTLFSASLPLLFLLRPHHLSRQSFALNQKAAAPRAPLPPPSSSSPHPPCFYPFTTSHHFPPSTLSLCFSLSLHFSSLHPPPPPYPTHLPTPHTSFYTPAVSVCQRPLLFITHPCT